MLFIIVFSSLTILLLSYLIAFNSRQQSQNFNSVHEYLFGHNNIILATTSNIGSILSLTLLITGIIPAIAGWGYAPIYGLYTGIITGYSIFYFSMKKILKSRSAKVLQMKVTIVELAPNKVQTNLRYLQIFLYFVAITLELAAAKYILNSILVNSFLISNFIVFIVLLLCAAYVSIGGYYGILRTDFFQICIFTIGAILTFLVISNNSYTQIIQKTFIPEYFKITDFFMFIGSLLIVVIYQFAFPDSWIRNIGTLKENYSKKFPTIRYGLIGLLIILIPPTVLSLDILANQNGLTKTLSIEKVLLILSTIFHNSEVVNNDLVMWWLFGGILCVIITT